MSGTGGWESGVKGKKDNTLNPKPLQPEACHAPDRKQRYFYLFHNTLGSTKMHF